MRISCGYRRCRQEFLAVLKNTPSARVPLACIPNAAETTFWMFRDDPDFEWIVQVILRTGRNKNHEVVYPVGIEARVGIQHGS